MAEGKKSAISEIFEDEAAGRLDLLHARTLAYSVAGEMENLAKLVAEGLERYKTSRAPEVRTRSALCAGVGLWIMRKHKEACEALEPVGNDKDGAYFLGLCRMELGEYPAATSHFQKAASAGQDEFVCSIAAVEALRRAGNCEEALARIRALQKSHDGEAELHYEKGRCIEAMAQQPVKETEPAKAWYERAIEAYERAVELNPQHAGALFRLGFLNDLRGSDERALDYYEKASALRPAHQNALLNLGVLYEDRGEYEKAARVYDRILAGAPTDPRVRMYRKDAVASLDMYYDEAIERRQSRTAALMRLPLSEFDLSARSRSYLEKMNIRTLGDLARLTETEIETSKNFGDTSLTELRALLESKGLRFGMGREETGVAPAAIASPPQSGALSKPVADLDLSVRSQKCMRILGVNTVGDLVEKSEKDLLQCQNFGITSLNEIKKKLEGLGLALKARE